MSISKTRPVCSGCGSEDVRTDAWATWDHEAQEWVLSSTYDDAYCNTCRGETSLKWTEVKDAEVLRLHH